MTRPSGAPSSPHGLDRLGDATSGLLLLPFAEDLLDPGPVEADPVADLPERQAFGAELTDFLGALGP
jgi:hypothetical protein